MKVSVITPLYNSFDWLESTVLSLQKQTCQDWELIIVDDHSVDGSFELAKKLVADDARVKLFRLSENGGAAVARNKGIELASGRYIAFLDSDDIWHSEKLEKQIKFMQENKYAFTYTAYEKIDESGLAFQAMGVPDKVSYHQLLKTCVIGCLTAIYDAELLGKVYMPTNTKREDFATWLFILKQVDYAYGMPDILAQYRVYANQSSSGKVKMAGENWRLYRDIEKLGVLSSVYYFINYAFRGVLRSKFPKFAKSIGVLD